MKKLSVLVMTIFLTASAWGARVVTTPAIQILKTGNLRGNFATLYFGFEKTSIIRADKFQISLSSVRSSRTIPIQGDSVTFPSVELEKAGFRGAYDTVVLVISNSQNFVWKNADESIPDGLTDTKINSPMLVAFKKIHEIDRWSERAGAAEAFSWPLF